MRFVDASVFLYAYLKPKKELPSKLKTLKENAKKIIGRIEEGEKVATTVVHLSEVANILEARIPLKQSIEIVKSIITLPNVKVWDVTSGEYRLATAMASEEEIGVNDALAVEIMRKHGINEIYSYDTDYDKIEGVKRITE